jgi:hypothetical protein
MLDEIPESGWKWVQMDENGKNGWIFGDKNVFLGPNFAKNRPQVKKIRLLTKFRQ